ncbi:MAG: ABC transporter ATP-binding protein [Actinomycetota bacterium]|nr:ABC transporter ATP-binding protein [Actinomycetota bacterium]
MALLTARSARKRFGALTAVDGVDCALDPGEVVGLLGANGAGKTTLIRMLLGLVEPTGGEVRLFGQPPSIRTRRRLGYVPQGLGLYEDLTVDENRRFTAGAFGDHSAPAATMPAGMGGALVRDVPLGTQRRIAVALALDHRPDLLVLDEPTSGVGPLGRIALWDQVREAAAGGAGVLVSTHAMDEAAQCDRVLVMAAGRVVASGTTRQVVGQARVVVVRTARWPAAFDALEAAGLTVALVGATLRVPGGELARVRAVLQDAGVDARLACEPATFEEAFVTLSGAAR